MKVYSKIAQMLEDKEGIQDLLLNYTIPVFTPDVYEEALTRDYGFAGLTVVPMAIVDNDDDGTTESTQVTRIWADKSGFTEDEIWDMAFSRLEQESWTIDMDIMIVATAMSGKLGSAAILTKKIQQELISRGGAGDYILQPSSRNETILSKAGEVTLNGAEMSLEAASAMVKEINEKQVAPKDRLIDRAYKIRIKAPGEMKVVAWV